MRLGYVLMGHEIESRLGEQISLSPDTFGEGVAHPTFLSKKSFFLEIKQPEHDVDH
jgi:hypothetical protein